MKVKIYSLRNGIDTVLGTIESQDGRLFVSPDNELLHDLCREPIMGKGGARIDSTDADRFVENLPYQYKSAYFRAVRSES